jgi:hypothetical protein
MPQVAEWVDLTRDVFCDTSTGLADFNQALRDRNFFAQENGITIGRPGPEGVTPIIIDRSIDLRLSGRSGR